MSFGISRIVSRNRERNRDAICYSEVSRREEPQRPSCSIQRMTYEGMFWMVMRDFTPHKNSIAGRSTKVTFARSRAIFSELSVFNAFCNSATYSLVSWPHKRTVTDCFSS
jgi:hypothetical protein